GQHGPVGQGELAPQPAPGWVVGHDRVEEELANEHLELGERHAQPEEVPDPAQARAVGGGVPAAARLGGLGRQPWRMVLDGEQVGQQAAEQDGEVGDLLLGVLLDEVRLELVGRPAHGSPGRFDSQPPTSDTVTITMAGPQIQLRMGVRTTAPPTTRMTTAMAY